MQGVGKMLKVVLVDDEPSVLEGLRIFVDWERAGYEIAGEASDGAAAFAVIHETRPELVISDIRMPGLTGLELIEKVNADISPAPKFILLSGYNDFYYAQKALQFGALGYLTKPLDAEELAAELSRAAGIVESEKNARQENLELIRYTANQLYNDIMDGKRSDRLSRKARFIFDIPENAKIRIVQFIADAGDKTTNYPRAEIYDLLIRITGIQNENCLFYNGGGSYLLIMHDGMQQFTDSAGLAEQFAVRLSGAVPGNYGVHAFWTLISGVSGSEVLENLDRCGKQLEQLQAYSMLHPENKAIFYDAPDESPVFRRKSETGVVTVIPELPFDRVVNALKGKDVLEVSHAVDEFFYELNRNVGSHRLCSICLYRLADVVRKIAYAYGINANKAILDFTGSIGSMNPGCKKLALDMCQSIFEKQNSNHVKPLVLLENEIIDYIKANYMKSLSLQKIAEKFSLPAMIVSKIVKKKTGYKFNDYFNYLRVEYAKTLFASADLKITTVSEKTGYADYNYFVAKFKEFTGVSPSEYKKKFS